jgi:hypothetical protein
MFSNFFFSKVVPHFLALFHNVGKYGTARQVTDGNIIRRVRFSSWIHKATDTHSEYGTARQVTDGNIIRRVRFASWILKAADTHSEYVILIAFQRQQRLRALTSVSKYIACLVLRFRTGSKP